MESIRITPRGCGGFVLLPIRVWRVHSAALRGTRKALESIATTLRLCDRSDSLPTRDRQMHSLARVGCNVHV